MSNMRTRLAHIVLLATLLLGSLAATAQPIYTGLDTIVGRYEKYYLPEWYDTCPLYKGGTKHYFAMYFGNEFGYVQSNDSRLPWPFEYNNMRVGNRYYATSRMAVKGIVGITYMDATVFEHPGLRFPPNLTQKLPEYFYLMQQVGSVGAFQMDMEVLDSVRWDNAVPLVWKIPKDTFALVTNDSARFHWVYAYEAYFDEPIIVDSAIYCIAGSQHSSLALDNELLYYPTFYYCFRIYGSDFCKSCFPKRPQYLLCQHPWYSDYWHILNPHWGMDYENTNLCIGPFFPIVDMFHVVGAASNPGYGSVVGGGEYPDRSIDTLWAVPNEGYRFSHWQDGDTINPRIFELTQDTLFIATFEPLPDPAPMP